MNNCQQTTLWLGALRYYIGRRGISDFTSLLIQEWDNLPGDTCNFITVTLEEAFSQDDRTRENFAWNGPKMWRLGDDCDRACWEQVRRLWNED
jgi:hypothetical protein